MSRYLQASSSMIAAGLQWQRIVDSASIICTRQAAVQNHTGDWGKMGRINVRTVSTLETLNNYVVTNFIDSRLMICEIWIRIVDDQKFEM